MTSGENVFAFGPEFLFDRSGFKDWEKILPAWLPDTTLVFTREIEYARKRNAGRLSFISLKGTAVPGFLIKDEIYSAGRYLFLKVLTENGLQKDAFIPRYVALPSGTIMEGGMLTAMKKKLPPSLFYWAEEAFTIYDQALINGSASYLIDHIITYGTLMKGYKGHELFNPDKNLISIEPAEVAGVLHDLGEYPGLSVPEEGLLNYVKGELMRLNNITNLLEILDDYEEFKGWGIPGSLYYRGIFRVKNTPAWGYVLTNPPVM